MDNTSVHALELIVTGISAAGALANFIIGLMLTRNVAQIKLWAHETFVPRNEFTETVRDIRREYRDAA